MIGPLVSLMCSLFPSPSLAIDMIGHGESQHVRYRTSTYGRFFLVAVPRRLLGDRQVSWNYTICTFEMNVSVTVMIPLDPSNDNGDYQRQEHLVSRDRPVKNTISNFPSHPNITVTGVASRIIASAEVTVNVLVYLVTQGFDLVTLPPVESYGKTYMLHTPRVPSFFVAIAAYHYTEITFYFIPPSGNGTCFQRQKRCQTKTILLNAARFYFMSPQTTDGQIRWLKGLTGSLVTATKPILLLTGTVDRLLWPIRDITGYPSFTEEDRVFLALAAALPTSAWSTEYIIITPSSRSNVMFMVCLFSMENNRGDVIGLPGHNFTTTEETPYFNFTLRRVGMAYRVTARLIFSVLVYSIDADHFYSGFLLYIVPLPLTPSYALFRHPASFRGDLYFYELMIIVLHDHRKLLMNCKSLAGKPWKEVPETYITSLDLRVTITYFELVMTDPRHKFVGYVTLERWNRRYATDTGMMFPFPLGKEYYNNCTTSLEIRQPGDNIDNDCDFRFDEELWNLEDDDGDGLIDEDVLQPQVAGNWGPWLSWFCDAKCQRTKEYNRRFRACDNPTPQGNGPYCIGPWEESGYLCRQQNYTCRDNDMCPRKTFRPYCSAPCPDNCQGPYCDRVTGVCSACEGGYRQSTYCQYKAYYEGPYPTEPKITKETPPMSKSYEIYLLPISLLVVVFMAILCREKDKREKKNLESESNSSFGSDVESW